MILFLIAWMFLLSSPGEVFAKTEVSGTISQNTAWTLAGSPYIVTADLTISEGVILTIDAGVAVKVKYYQIIIKGTLVADGNASQKIYFTSWKDDEVGGDTNEDGSATSPARGDWRGLYFYSESINNVLDNTVIRYSGISGYYYNYYALSVATSSLTISQSVIEHNNFYGIYVYYSSPIITGNTIRSNSLSGIYLRNSEAEIKNNTITKNGQGIYAYSSAATISGNTITDNNDYAIFLENDPFKNTVSGNTIRDNGINHLCIGGNISESITLGNYELGNVYVIYSSMAVSNDTVLTIEPGTIIKFLYYGVSVSGTLKADGTPEKPIYFTSLRDDTVGGDTNGDGSNTTPSRGNWRNLYFYDSSAGNVLDNVVVRYGSGFNIYTSGLTLSNSTIEQNYDMLIYSASPSVTGNRITNNNCGIKAYSSSAMISGNTITDNDDYAIFLENDPFNNTVSDNTIERNGINHFCLGGTISQSITLKPYVMGNLYVFYSDMTVAKGAKLTIEKGMVIKFRYYSLSVNGTLVADGTPEQPIYFTSLRDDEAGGDTNGDGSDSTPSRGNWRNLYFYDSSAGNVVDNVVVRYGTGLDIHTSGLTLSNSTIEESNSYGIHIYKASSSVTGCIFRNNNYSGIYLEESESLLADNVVSMNGSGIRVSSSTPTMTGNTITENKGYAIYLENHSFNSTLSNNSISGNGINPIAYGGIISESLTLDIPDSGDPYVVISNWQVSKDVTLTIKPGVFIKFDGQYSAIYVSGTLKADATPEQPICFTSLKDDTIGGDTNGDGNASSPARGNWSNLNFYSDSSNNVLDNVIIRYGGGISTGTSSLTVSNSTIEENSGDGISISGASPSIIGCVIRSNSDTGIDIYYNSSPTIKENTICKNNYQGIKVSSSKTPVITENDIWGNRENGIFLQSSSDAEITFNKISSNNFHGILIRSDSNATATNNQIFMNRNSGILNESEYKIDAAQTWWGDSDSSGPYHETENTDGTGNAISDNVTCTPFQTAVATPFSYRNFSETAGSTYGSMTPPELIQGTLYDGWDSYNKRPDRTVARDNISVIIGYSGLQAAKRYKIRISYYNGESSGNLQSLTDENDNLIHGPMTMPRYTPEQYEFPIPSSFYSSGTLRLKFVNANQGGSGWAALPEIWLMEDDSADTTPPRFDDIEYNDADGSETLSIGDSFTFYFSEDMDTSLIRNGTTDANTRLKPGTGIYGTLNQIRWEDGRTLVVTLTNGFTITGTETVTPSGITDVSGNSVSGSHTLFEGHDEAPELVYILFNDADGSGTVSIGDSYIFGFSEPMRTAPLSDNTTEGNVNLSPEGKKYGYRNPITWNAEHTECVIEITYSFTVTGSELVDPTDEVTDTTGNPVSNTMSLTLTDTSAKFAADPAFGDAVPMTVQFTDLSTGNPNSWKWDFDDDGTIDSQEQHPVFTYTEEGIYSVRLIVTNAYTTYEKLAEDYIQAGVEILASVSDLRVLQSEDDFPVISWNHFGDAAGYNVYADAAGELIKLNQNLLTAKSYEDTGYTGAERTYIVAASDERGYESPYQSLILPLVHANPKSGEKLVRGVMNRLEFLAENRSSSPIEHALMKVEIGGEVYTSESFSINGKTSQVIAVTVEGTGDLPDWVSLTSTIEITPNQGGKVEIIRTSELEVSDGMLVLGILNEEFVRGQTAKVRFTLENTGEEEIEIVTATGSGSRPSDEITFSLSDADGNLLSTGLYKQTSGTEIISVGNRTVARIPAGGIFTSESADIDVPLTSPDDVFLELEISSVHYHLGQSDEVTLEGLSARSRLSLADTSYYGEVLTITPETSDGNENIEITGRAVERAAGSAMAEVPLNLVISLNGFERKFQVFTDTQGKFHHTFVPLSNEYGTYTVWAVHPDVTAKPVQGKFVIQRVSISPAEINLNIPRNYEQQINVSVIVGGTDVHNLQLAYNQADQIGRVFPQGLHVTADPAVSELKSGDYAMVGCVIWADNMADETGKITLKVKSDETDSWGTVIIYFQFSEANPALFITPNHIETGVAREDRVIETLTLENKGLASLDDVILSLVQKYGTSAPTWAALNSNADQDAVAVGESREVSISFNPGASVAEGMYEFYLRVESSNHPVTDVPLFVSVSQSGKGNVRFQVSDIYTGTVDPDTNKTVEGLEGAKIRVQNEEVLTIDRTLTTDAKGEALFSDLPTGRYKYKITKENHQEKIGRLWIRPGITLDEEVFLSYNPVTVEWEVTETTIEDKYEIVLKATYETDVPMPVVVVEPASVRLPDMKTGDVFYGEFKLTNYGLVKAEALMFAMPQDNENFRHELLAGIPDMLAAKEEITVPYKVICLKSLDQGKKKRDGDTSCYVDCGDTCYEAVVCSNPLTIETRCVPFCFQYGVCTSAGTMPVIPYIPSGGSGYVSSSSGGSSGSGGTSSGTSSSQSVGYTQPSVPAYTPYSPPSEPIDGVVCWPDQPMTEEGLDGNPWCDPKLFDTSVNTNSSVNTVFREYNDDVTDLYVKVPGGNISVRRRFYENQWYWEHSRNNLQFNQDSLGKTIQSIDKGGVIYEKSADDLYVHDETYKIRKTETGYIWKDKAGTWKEYDSEGRMTAYGTRNGSVGKLLYQTGENGKLIGIGDKDDQQVIWFEYDNDDQISAAYDNNDRRVEYGYTDGKLTSVTDVLANKSTYLYDSEGRLTKKTDAAGRPVSISYDTYGNVSQVLDKEGEGHFFEYNYDDAKNEFYAMSKTSAGKVKEVWYDRNGETKQVNINGRTVKTIEKDGRNLIIRDENGNATRKYYDEWENLTRVVYPDESEVTYEYEHTFNKPTRRTDERGIVTAYAYDDMGNITKMTEAAGTPNERITEYTYDDDGNRLTEKRLGDEQSAESVVSMGYDESGNMISIKDPEGNTTVFTHNYLGKVLTRKDARGKVWKYEYDKMGRLASLTDPLANVTRFAYDAAGNRIKETDAGEKATSYVYDQDDNVIRATDALGHATVFDYDSDGRLIRVTDAEGKVTRQEYDADGRLAKTIDGNGNETVYQYDDASGSSCSSCSGGKDQPSKITYPTFAKAFKYDNRSRKVEEKDVLNASETYLSQFFYDDAGSLIKMIDKEGRITSYKYDELSRQIKVTDALNGVTEFTYDNRDNLISLKDAEGNVTLFEYNRNNRMVRETRPMGEETVYRYDKTGNLFQKLDAKGQMSEYEYDDAGRMVNVRYFSAGQHDTPVKTVSFAYDKTGNLKSYDDGVTSAAYAYDDLYRKTSETVKYGGFELTHGYAYHKNGLKKSFTGPDGISYEYAYDGSNQLKSILIPGKGSITYDAYKWYRPKSVKFPGNSVRTYNYDSLMRTQSILAKASDGNILMNYQYAYDKMDNILSKSTDHGNYAYGYDELYRLTRADNPVQDDEAFSYDGVGNRLTSADVTGDWRYNQNNELLGYAAASYSYDDNGNMVQKTEGSDVVRYVYNVEDRLSRVENGDGAAVGEYYYDPFGRRLWKTADGKRTYFHYADEGLVGEYDSAGTEIKTYGYKPDSVWTTDPCFMKVGGEYYFYQNDHLGTPMRMVDVTGGTVWAARYDSFGEAEVATSSPVTNNLRFAGQYFDVETGLHYNRFRYYEPRNGRFLREDPVRNLNLYTYCMNNPMFYIDPLGTDNIGCDKIADITPAMQEICAVHDFRYEIYGCKWTSFLSENAITILTIGAVPLGQCGEANKEAFFDIAGALLTFRGDDPSRPNYYNSKLSGPASPDKFTDVGGPRPLTEDIMCIAEKAYQASKWTADTTTLGLGYLYYSGWRVKEPVVYGAGKAYQASLWTADTTMLGLGYLWFKGWEILNYTDLSIISPAY